MSRRRDNSLGDGVYFASDAYVGIGRRLLILIVDAAVLIFAYILFWSACFFLLHDPVGPFLLAVVAITWIYLAVVKQSELRTVGLRMTDARVVTLRGQKPSILRMTFRMMLWMFGPFNFIYDLVWTGPDNECRTLRDCFAGTCVVNHTAKSVGTAEIHLVHYHAFGFNLTYPRACRPNAE